MKKTLPAIAFSIIAALASPATQAHSQDETKQIFEMTMTGTANPMAVCQQADNSRACVRTVERVLWQLTPQTLDALRATLTPEALRAARPADLAKLLAYSLVETDHGRRGSIWSILAQGDQALADPTRAPWPRDLLVNFDSRGATVYQGQRVYLRLLSN